MVGAGWAFTPDLLFLAPDDQAVSATTNSIPSVSGDNTDGTFFTFILYRIIHSGLFTVRGIQKK